MMVSYSSAATTRETKTKYGRMTTETKIGRITMEPLVKDCKQICPFKNEANSWCIWGNPPVARIGWFI